MDFSKPRNIVLLIISLLVIISLSINASLAWFNLSANDNFTKDVTVLKFDFLSHGKEYSKDVLVTLNVTSPTNYATGYIAPGVKGYHTFSFSNANSGVPVKYTVTFNRNSSTFPSNMIFYIMENSTQKAITNGVVWENVPLAKGATDSSKTFYFDWKFVNTQETYTAGKIELNFTINAYQV